MPNKISDREKHLQFENEELKLRLSEAEQTLDAIRNGEVDAIVVSGPGGEKIFSLTSAETPYRLLVEEMQEGAVTISAEGTILYCNKSFEELVAVPMQKIIGTNFGKFIRKGDRQAFDFMLHEMPRRKIADEIVFYDINKNQKYLHLSYCPMPEGVIGKICIIVTDITELKKYQEDLQRLVDERTNELEQAILQLKESNATKDKLFSIIAHDLKGPFTSLLGFSELLIGNTSKYDTEQFEMMINHIHSAAKNAYSLLENLLMWAMSQNKLLKFNPQPTNVATLITEVTRNLKSLMVMKSISLTCNLPDRLPGYIDTNMFKAILRNLVGNAIKYAIQGGNITIVAHSNKEKLEVTVTDDGIGMSEETKQNLFKPETNESVKGTSQGKGTGLVLLISYEFINTHKGTLTLESDLGKGSTFTVSFPHKGRKLIRTELLQHAGSISGS